MICLLQVKFGIIAPFFLVDSFTNCTGYRNAELAVMLGKLYLPEEALKFGIVDELADSKEAAMTRSELNLQRYSSSLSVARF